jgi:soluble lytic murein transglycosylase-like protein
MKFDSMKLMDAVKKAAGAYDLDPAIVMAVVMTESGGCQYAARYEATFKNLLDPERMRPLGCSIDTETMLQKTSFGLMQVMGAVLREKGFRGWLTEILDDVDAQLDYGCRHLARFLKMHGTIEKALASYNAGSPRVHPDGKLVNINYVEKVLAAADGFRNVNIG